MAQRALLPVVSPYRSVCEGCPAERVDVFEPIVRGGFGACRLRRVTLTARRAIPMGWSDLYAFALVHTGVVVRTVLDVQGAASAVDCVGPGGLLPLHGASDAASSGHAAGDASLCLVPHGVVESLLEHGGDGARDVMKLHTRALARIEALAHARACRDARKAIARLLVTLTTTLQPPEVLSVIPAALQQRDVAVLLGLRHETVCRVLADFARDSVTERVEEGLRVDARALEAVLS